MILSIVGEVGKDNASGLRRTFKPRCNVRAYFFRVVLFKGTTGDIKIMESASEGSVHSSRKWAKGGELSRFASVTVSTLNTLADGLGLEDFNLVPPMAVDWTHRRHVLLKSVLEEDPDLICLQELNRFHDFMNPALAAKGYTGVFGEKKVSPCEQFGMPKDGCAIFVKAEKFAFLSFERVVFSGSSSQIFLIAVLEHRATLQPLILVTTHLKAKKPFEKVRVAQAEQLVDKIRAVQKQYPGAATILTGDLNTEPLSDSYRLISTLLSSAYFAYESDESFYSTWKVRPSGEVCHTIDYIFHSNCAVVDVLLPPTNIPQSRLPTLDWPSDHISLIAAIVLPTKERAPC